MLLSKFCSLFFGLHEMSNEDNCTSSDEKYVLHEEEVTCCCTHGLNPLYYYTENDKQYYLQPFAHYFDGKYLYISRSIANRYFRYNLEEARRERLRIPLRMSNGNIVLARADLLRTDELYITQMKYITQQLNREYDASRETLRSLELSERETHQQEGYICKSATITTALTVLSTMLIALVLHH